LGVTRRLGEAEVKQIDAKETAKKSDGAKTRSWAGATPLSALGLESDPWGRSRPSVQHTAPSVLAPSPQGKERERNEKRRKRKQMLADFEQPVTLRRKVRLEQDTSKLLEDYAGFIGIGAEDLLNIVLRKMIADDMEFQSWLSHQNVQQQGSQSSLGRFACVVETEAA